ncbi:MAG: hypothetical protein GY803_24435 [Chloroflexi bacterium]|nr:hypothetical protein [Chloroflexota bacterium]
MVEEYRQGDLSEEFQIRLITSPPVGTLIYNDDGGELEVPSTVAITGMRLKAVAAENLILLQEEHIEYKYNCGLLQKIFAAVDTNFGELEGTLEPHSENLGGLGLNLPLFAQILAREFNLKELDDLLFNMGIGNEDIPGDTIKDKAREVVKYAQRHGRLRELLIRAAKLRHRSDWSSLYQ